MTARDVRTTTGRGVHGMRAALGLVLVAGGVAGCGIDQPPVAWEAPRTATGAIARVPFDVRPSGELVTLADTVAARADTSTGAAPLDATTEAGADARLAWGTLGADGTCGIVRTVDRTGRTWGSWWRVRPDSSAVLEVGFHDGVAANADGAWTRVLVVDTLDRAARGCDRPQPALVADSVNGYVHVAYWSQAVEGPGLFYAHLMDPRATHFEPPTALVYGELAVRAAVRSRGDTVAIAYEDPNSERGRIALHVSLTAGHLFEQTARIIRVNTGQQPASEPRVAVGGGRVVVAWRETSPRGDAVVVRGARIVAPSGAAP